MGRGRAKTTTYRCFFYCTWEHHLAAVIACADLCIDDPAHLDLSAIHAATFRK